MYEDISNGNAVLSIYVRLFNESISLVPNNNTEIFRNIVFVLQQTVVYNVLYTFWLFRRIRRRKYVSFAVVVLV